MAQISEDETTTEDGQRPLRGDWSFIINNEEFHWLPVEPHILPEEDTKSSIEVVSSIYRTLAELNNADGVIKISPVGPFLSPDVSDDLAVFYVVRLLYPQAHFYGDAPDNFDLGIDDGQDNNPVIN